MNRIDWMALNLIVSFLIDLFRDYNQTLILCVSLVNLFYAVIRFCAFNAFHTAISTVSTPLTIISSTEQKVCY